jgi:hypothetical protein
MTVIESPTHNLSSALLDGIVYSGKSEGKNDSTFQLQSWKGFMRYEASFVALFFLELLWNRLDTLVASFLFEEAHIATQSAWMNIVMIIGKYYLFYIF